MLELKALPAFGSAYEKSAGTATLIGIAETGALTSLAPYKGKTDALSAVLKSKHGISFPMANRAETTGGGRILWFGHNMALLMGPVPDAALSEHAALTDQSDAWTCLQLSGAGAEAVLARLAPVDLRLVNFPVGATARTLLEHVNASVTREAEDCFLILVFRSMTGTVIHEIERAMENVAALG